MSNYTELAKAWRKSPDQPALLGLAETAVAGMSPSEHRDLAALYVAERVRAAARALARTDERRAAPGRDDPGFDFSALNSLVERRDAKLRAQWSAGLLATSFSVDGVIVTWGDATVEQHTRRAAALRRQASGTIETAQRHELAARQCDDIGVACLNDGLAAAA